MARRGIVLLALAALLGLATAPDARAHGGLRLSNPSAGATLGASPAAVQLSFTEQPEPSLSAIRVLAADGEPLVVGPATLVADDPNALAVRVKELPRGIYRVEWRVVSAVDGHATTGAYVFGVGIAPPAGAGAQELEASSPSSALELAGRWLLLAGLALLVGTAAAAAARFGGAGSGSLAAAGWILAAAGLALVAEAQRRYAEVPVADLLETSVGRAHLRRTVAVAAAGAALLLARHRRRAGLVAAGLAALTAIWIHVGAGHAAAGGWPSGASIAGQWAHFAAAGVWLGGLAALLLGARGAPSAVKTAAVRRFSAVALAALAVVAVTGVLRAVDELGSWRELGSTGYGRAIVLKLLLIGAIVGLGALHRRRSLPVAARDLGPLRRISQGELVLAAAALAVAAVLGSIPPPAAGQGTPPPGIVASGSAAGVRAKLEAASASPGANAFTVRLDGGAGPVRLRFRPLDDPGVAETTLALRREGDAFTGTGDDLAFDGRWRVTVEAGRARVPLELEVQAPPQRVSIERIPGEAPKYTVQVDLRNLMRFSPDPERPGRSVVTVTSYDEIEDEQPLASLVVTHAAGDGPVRQVPVRRVGPGRFLAEVQLVAGKNTLTGIARKPDGTRLRASAGLDVPD